MIKSPLATETYPAYEGNFTYGRSGRKIEAITIHHMAGRLTAKQCGEIFQQVGRCGSSHYGIGYNGEIACYVGEENTAWTNSNWDSNCKSVTIETSDNDNSWYVNDTTLNSLIRLVADIAKRNNLGTLVKGKNLTWHSMFTATDCPGAYLLSMLDYIIDEANKINGGSAKNHIIYQTYDNQLGKYWSEITDYNNNDSNGYAGCIGHSIGGIRARASSGTITIQSHIKNGDWLSPVTKWDNTADGYSGIYGRDIDMVMVKCSAGKVRYRVHLKDGNWLPWVSNYNINDSEYGMAGIYGKSIDAIQMEII